ncbi:MAG: NAD-dependent malic enzyme [Legionellaceae bacterium]|nr:NAD-dependent malic enzyme [Legionellaceae bacterium]
MRKPSFLLDDRTWIYYSNTIPSNKELHVMKSYTPVYKNIHQTDFTLVNNPILNKGTGFTPEEREKFHLYGIIPPELSSLAEQKTRSYNAFKSKKTDLEKYLYLRDLQDSNETLFYSLLCDYTPEMLPIVYTPTVGEACTTFSHIYRRPRGLFLAYPYQNRIESILANKKFDHVRAIVVSDGERILGLGDQGAGGMGIPIGKLALYCACAGIHPAQTLPILLDTGTNNPALINDPLYIGWRHERVRGQEYDDFVATFVHAVKKRFPHVLLQWEDFAIQNANRLLDAYRSTLCTFNDDIQGTAAIATGTLLAAVGVTGHPLQEQRIVIVGAGSAGCGIAELIVHAMLDAGVPEKTAREQIYLIDKNGLLVEDTPDLLPFQQKHCHSKAHIGQWVLENPSRISLEDVIQNVHPHALVGVSGQAGLFNEALIKKMASFVEQPIILPLSNPSSHSEAIPQDLMNWTHNKAVIGTGSPFGTVQRHGKPFLIDQTNNAHIFPGLGLGLIAIQAKIVPDALFMVAAKTLANCSPAKKDKLANLLPPFTDVRKTSFAVALAVAKAAVKLGIAEEMSEEAIIQRINNHIWEPQYYPYNN